LRPALRCAILVAVWLTAALSIFQAIGSQESGAAQAQAEAIARAKAEQAKVTAIGLGIVGAGLLAFLAMRPQR
jgi:hypothetical protein